VSVNGPPSRAYFEVFQARASSVSRAYEISRFNYLVGNTRPGQTYPQSAYSNCPLWNRRDSHRESRSDLQESLFGHSTSPLEQSLARQKRTTAS